LPDTILQKIRSKFAAGLVTCQKQFAYLKFMADLRHIPNSKIIVLETLEQVGLLDRANGYIGNLSKGMRQRVGLAQALVHKPEVLILDEPTIGLDPAQIIDVRNLIRETGKERTVLLSTHILSEAQQLCDRILIINNGKIVVEDTPENLQTRLTGGELTILRARGGAIDTLAGQIAGLPGVKRAKATVNGVIEIQSDAGTEIRAEVARLAITSGYELLELRSSNMSLEEIFLHLTRDIEAGKE
jgi:ABC-2 type transport system ATP-binding protein